jgi:hypothetical protein
MHGNFNTCLFGIWKVIEFVYNFLWLQYVFPSDSYLISYNYNLCFKQYPTKALAPLMLEDYRKVMVDHRGEEEQYSYDDIQRCMKKGNVWFQHFFHWSTYKIDAANTRMHG